LRCVADGLTTGELAQVVGVLPSVASRHTWVLRYAGLTTGQQIGSTVLHTLTPLGTEECRAGQGELGWPESLASKAIRDRSAYKMTTWWLVEWR